MRRANTTFVNLRATLDDAAPLVEESKPVARKLRPFFAELRPLARDARPTLRDLSRTIRAPGADNDLIELTQAAEPLRDIAVSPAPRDGQVRDGALPATTKALSVATPELATARPYAPDLTGWFDDFSHSGLYDALGGASRAGLYVNLFANVNGVLKPLLDADDGVEGARAGPELRPALALPGRGRARRDLQAVARLPAATPPRGRSASEARARHPRASSRR